MAPSKYVAALREVRVPLEQIVALSVSLQTNPNDQLARQEMADAARLTRKRIQAIVTNLLMKVPSQDRFDLGVAAAHCKALEEALEAVARKETLNAIECIAVQGMARETVPIIDQLLADIDEYNRSAFVKGLLAFVKGLWCVVKQLIGPAFMMILGLPSLGF